MKYPTKILAISLLLSGFSAGISNAQMATPFNTIMEPPAPTMNAPRQAPIMQNVPMITPVVAPTMMVPTAPQFTPSGPWTVEKTAFAQTRGLNGVRLPCMMAANYNNGYVLRLSGHSGQILAMAVDFRQNVFKQGRKYPSAIGLNQFGNFKTTATAFSESTLIFNLRSYSGFYQQLQGAGMLTLDVDGNAFVFNLGNVPEALNRLEACFGPAMANSVTTASMMGQVERPQTKREPTNSVKDWNQKVEPSAPRSSVSAPQVQAPMTMRWQAKAGDDIRDTLNRWSNRAGIALSWQSDRGGQVVSDINVTGSFEQAVQMLMAQNSTALGIDAMMAGKGAPRPMSPMAPLPVASTPQSILPPQNVPAPEAPSQWAAPAGADLQVVLQQWSKREGVDFVWQAHHEFKLKRAVNGGQSYEAALQAILSQFSNDGVRPAAQLNNDPQTGNRLLIVQSTRVL